MREATDNRRLLLVVDSVDHGGAERYVADLATALAARGHRVDVACSAGGMLEPELQAAGVAVRPLLGRVVKRRASASYARALRALVRSEDYELVHAHIYASAVAAAVALEDEALPLVLTEHTEGPWRDRAARETSRWAYARAAHVVAVSSAIERVLVDGYGVAPERVTRLLPVLSPPRSGHAPLRPVPALGPVVGRVCRLAPEKGVDVFLEAAALVAAEVPDARFQVIGDGPERAALALRARTLGLGRHVRFLGHRPDARRLIAGLDVMAVSSLSDGAPLVALEAMEAGVPVVASAVGGLPDQLRHDREGLLVPPGDPRALAEAILALLADPVRARRLGAAGRRRVARLSHAGLVARVEAIYASAIADGLAARATADHSLCRTGVV